MLSIQIGPIPKEGTPYTTSLDQSLSSLQLHRRLPPETDFLCAKKQSELCKSSLALMDISRQNKIQKFEEFVDQRLKPDLVHAIAERDKVFEQQKVFSDLRKNIENLEKNSVTSLRTLVNLGSEVYMQADVPDTRRMFIDIGLGFHVEFTWSEALNYISQREEKLARQVEVCTNLIASIKAQVKLVCEGIRELLQLPAEAKTASQRIF